MTLNLHLHRLVVVVGLLVATAGHASAQPGQPSPNPSTAQEPIGNGAAAFIPALTPALPTPALPAPASIDPSSAIVFPASHADTSANTASLLPANMSAWSMFLSAGSVVQSVMIALALASVATWTILFAKSYEIAVARRRLRVAVKMLVQASSLGRATAMLGTGNGVAHALMDAAQAEWKHSADALHDRDGLKERISLHLDRVEASAGRRMTVGTGILASIGSVAPFVGLFGTVWGIMSSFIGIARLHTTNLAVVAPGIAEALLATAAGLVAAIPAVIVYNHFSRQIAGYKALVADAASSVLRLVSRDLSRGIVSNKTASATFQAAD